MKTYVISLKNQSRRRAHMTQELGKHGIDFTFFDAVEGSDIDRINQQLGLQVAQNTQFSSGEKGCFLSHASLWQKMCDENLPYITILEDDVFLGQNAAAFLNDDTWLRRHNIELIKIETFLQNKKLGKNRIDLSHHRQAVLLCECHLGTGGYIISRFAAEKILHRLRAFSANDLIPIDHLLFDRFIFQDKIIPIHQMLPALCVQEFILYPNTIAMPSIIEPERRVSLDIRRLNRPKRTLSAKLKGELGNAWRKTFGKIRYTFIDFQ